jgi:hypothetical protein
VESKRGYSTRIFIVLYEPYGVGIYENVVDKTKIRVYDDNWTEKVRKRLLEVVGDAILTLSGKEIEKDYHIPLPCFLEVRCDCFRKSLQKQATQKFSLTSR